MIAESAYLIGRQLGPTAEAAFFRAVAAGELQVETITPADAGRIAHLIDTYADLGLGGTDASLVALAEHQRQRRRVLHDAVEVASEVALEDARRFAGCLALGDAARDVVACRRVVLAAVEDDGVQRAVELTVAAAAEAVTDRLTAGGW